MRNRYDSPVQLTCYDNDGGDGGDGGEGGTGEGGGTGSEAGGSAGGGTGSSSDRTFTQAEVNKFLADDRRKMEAKYRAQEKAALEKKSAEYRELSQRASLTEQERDDYRQRHDDAEKALAEFMTEKEKLLKERRTLEEAYKAQVDTLEKDKSAWETRYKSESVSRELQAAAVKHGAFSVQQMVNALRPYSKVVPTGEAGDFKVVVDLADEVDGKSTVTTLAPDELLARMKQLPKMYGNMFQANVVAGVGGNSGSGNAGSGPHDLKHMSQEQFKEWAKQQQLT